MALEELLELVFEERPMAVGKTGLQGMCAMVYVVGYQLSYTHTITASSHCCTHQA